MGPCLLQKPTKNPFDSWKICHTFGGHNEIIEQIEAVRPGFINIKIKNSFLINYIQTMFNEKNFTTFENIVPKNIIVDYGGANVAKPLHIGHLRSAIIGESLKRCAKFLGNNVAMSI